MPKPFLIETTQKGLVLVAVCGDDFHVSSTAILVGVLTMKPSASSRLSNQCDYAVSIIFRHFTLPKGILGADVPTFGILAVDLSPPQHCERVCFLKTGYRLQRRWGCWWHYGWSAHRSTAFSPEVYHRLRRCLGCCGFVISECD